MINTKLIKGKEKRKIRVRQKVNGTSERPRLSIFRSNKYVYGQIIDDITGNTLVSTFDVVKSLHAGKSKIEGAALAGEELAKRALEKNISQVVFDRNGYRYHGRVKSFADGARKGGLNF